MPQGQGKLSLAVNCGSSSIKFQLYAEDSFDVILSGAASNISTSEASFKYTLASSGDTTSHDLDESKPYPQVFEDILNEITSDKVLGQDGVERIGIVAHRIVHGGAETEPILIMHGDKKEQETLDRMDEVSAFAPLHNQLRPPISQRFPPTQLTPLHAATRCSVRPLSLPRTTQS